MRGAQLGWTSLLVAERDGGGTVSGNGIADLVTIARECGRCVAPGPLVSTNVVAASISRAGSDRLRHEVLPSVLAGTAVCAWCVESPARRQAGHGAIVATFLDDGFVLNGSAVPVESPHADYFLVAAGLEGNLTQFLVASDCPGVHVHPVRGIDLTRRLAKVEFNDVWVPADAVVGRVGEAARDVEHLLNLAIALQCTEMTAAIERMFEVTTLYAFDRYSFGRPLASYQALKHRLADMKVVVEACLATSDAAARAVASDGDAAWNLVRVAKAYVGEHAPQVLQDCVQIHGGIGVTWEHDLHLFIRRVLHDRGLLGTPEAHRELLADRLGL